MADRPTPTARSAEDVTLVDDHLVSCDGGGGALGHPVVWYEMGAEGKVICKYCDRVFLLKGGPADPARG